MSCYRWQQEALGEHAKYRKHPVILACVEMDRHPDLDVAMRCKPRMNVGIALSDNFIFGAGYAQT